MFKIPKGEFASNILITIRTKKVGLNKDGKIFSKVAFAETIGYDRVTIIKVERGERSFTGKLLSSISETFNKPIEELVPEFIAEKYKSNKSITTSEIKEYEKRRLEQSEKNLTKSDVLVQENYFDPRFIESLKARILNLEEDKKRLILENDRLIGMLDKMIDK